MPLLGVADAQSLLPDLFLTCSETEANAEEKRCRRVGGTLRQVPPSAPITEPVLGVMKTFKEFERLAAAAVLDGTRRALAEVLATHPWVKGGATTMAEQILAHCQQWRSAEDMIRCLN